MYFVGNTYNQVYIWCCKYGENRYYVPKNNDAILNKQAC